MRGSAWMVLVMCPAVIGCKPSASQATQAEARAQTREDQAKDAKARTLVSNLVYAAERGRVAEVKKWLEAGAEVNGKTRDGDLALLAAARRGQKEVVEVLLQHGATVVKGMNIDDKDALSAAAFACSAPILRLFVTQDSELAEVNERNSYLLYAASSCRDTSTLKFLLEHGLKPAAFCAKADQPTGALHRAACLGTREIVEILLREGLPVTLRNEDGRTPFIEAARCGKLEQMDALLKAGADINATDNTHQTALIVATRSGSTQAVAELLRRGARTDIVDDEGATALDYARRQGHRPELLEMLSKHSPPRR